MNHSPPDSRDGKSVSPPGTPSPRSERKKVVPGDLEDQELEQEYLESVRKETAKGRTMTSIGGGLLLAAGTTLVNPLLAVPAAIIGIGAGYKMYKERERSSVENAEKMLTLGDTPGVASEGSSRPPLRRLIFLVRWASLQIATDLDNGDIKASRLERVYDETILSFSAWVQRIYYVRAEKSKTKRDQEERLLKLHLSPLVRWLQSSPSTEVLMMVNHEFSKEMAACIASSDRSQEGRFVRRCRSVFPAIIEVSHLFKLDNPDESRYGQLVDWISNFLRKPDIMNWLADAHMHADTDHPAPVIGPIEDDQIEIEFPPLGVEQEVDEIEFYSASEGEEDDDKHTAQIARVIGKHSPEVPDWAMFKKAENSDSPEKNSWCELDGTKLMVRGGTYLDDKKKVDSKTNMFTMLCFDLFYTDHPIPCVSKNQNCKAYWLLKNDPDLFTFTINWRLHPMQAAVTYGVRKNACDWILDPNGSPERTLLERFLDASTKERNEIIKIIPKVSEGPWIVKKAVGQTPAIIGRKLKVDYHEEPGRYFEAEYDVLSTTAAKSMISLVVGAAKRLVIDVGIVLEGKNEDELPERILGGFSINYPDLTTCRRITLGNPVDDGSETDD